MEEETKERLLILFESIEGLLYFILAAALLGILFGVYKGVEFIIHTI